MKTAACAAALLAVVELPRSAAAAPVTEVHYVMGTYFSITVEEAADRPAMRRCFAEARRLEGVFSRFDPGSELSRLNGGGAGAVRVSPDLAHLLRASQRLAAATGGTFDVTVGPLTALWRRNEPPTPGELAAARARVGTAAARLDGERVTLVPGARLDFDGIAKGYAVDGCTELLRRAGVRRALVSLGESSVAAIGAPRGERHWTLAVRGADPDEVVGVLRLRDRAASVSATFGDRGRKAGALPGRIVDPHTGRALADDAVAVVVSGSATDAEAYSKALLLWGASGVTRVERLGAAGAVRLSGRAVHQGPRAVRARLFTPAVEPRPLTAAEAPLS